MTKRKNNNFNVLRNKNSYVGRTYRVKDNDLPHKNAGSGKIVDIAIVEENGINLGGVRTTTKKTKNTRPFHSKHLLYKGYKTFLETKFHNGDDITAYDKRLKENPWKYNLSSENVYEVRNNLYYHSQQAIENRKKKDELHNSNKKSRH